MDKQNLSVQINIAPFDYGLPGVMNRQNYTKALMNEILSAIDYADDYVIGALYITGSTPLQYPKETLAEIIDELKQNLPFLPTIEITIHALPGSVTYGDLRTLYDHGVNRISFDMRTFVQSELDAIQRTYAPRSMEVFMRMVQLKMIYFNYDVTLYYGLPGQTLESLCFSIEQAIRFMAAHITLLPHQEVGNIDYTTYYQEAVKNITSMGFEQYTPIHFARPGFSSIWNKLAYSTQPRLGFGVGAISNIDSMVIHNVNDVHAYMSANGDPSKTIQKVEPISQTDVEHYSLINKLFNLEKCDTDTSNLELKKQIDQCCEIGLFSANGNIVTLTESGKANWQSVINHLKI